VTGSQLTVGRPAHPGGPLRGVRVIDCSEGVAGPLAARLLGDMGAEVLKVEPPEGDRSRRLPPEDDGSGRDSFFEYLNWNKRGITLDLDNAAGRQGLHALARGADIVIESSPPSRRAGRGLSYEDLARENTGLVVISVTPFGSTGPRRDWETDELVDWAFGGYMYFGGNPEREPLQVPGYQAEYHAAQATLVAVLAALRYRDLTGEGQWIDQSVQEATLSSHAWLSVAWSHGGQVLTRVGPDMMECRDGWVMWLRRAQEPTVFVMIGKPELIEEFAEADVLEWRDPASPIWEHVRAWCRTQSMADVYHQAQQLRIPVTPVNTMEDLLQSEQLAHREWFLQASDTSAIRHAGFPFKMQASKLAIRHPAPTLRGEGDAGVSWHTREAAPAEELASPPSFADGPLAGLRVLEVTANWAGPLAGRHFGDLGAEVIKVEHSKRPATRAMWPAGNDPADRQFNRSGYFNKLNRNKMDVSLDLASPEGRAVFLKLVERADVLIENNSARVMPNLGLGYETLAEVNPRLVMASISGFGATGPEQHYVAYGANIEASSGLASIMGYADDARPYRAGTFYADPVAGNYTVIAVLAALRERRWTGHGQWIDLSLNEAAATFFGGYFVRYQREGLPEPRRGNRHQVFAPQGCYRTIGNDAWVALTIRDDDDWRGLATVLERFDWLIEPQFQTASGRAECHEEIDDAIRGWAIGRDHRRAAQELQDAGVPAAPVMANWELLSDPHLAERSFYVPITHPEVGVLPFPGMPWKLTRTPGTIRRPAPMFAQHNREVLCGILGMSDADVDALEASGVAAPDPEPSFFAPRPAPIRPKSPMEAST